MQAISEAGRIDVNGNLLLPMDRLHEEFRKRKGMRVVATFEFAQPHTTESQRGYYRGYVLPTIQAALRKQGTLLSIAEVDASLREWCPFEVAGKEDMSDFLEWLKQYAAENIHVYIEDPRVL